MHTTMARPTENGNHLSAAEVLAYAEGRGEPAGQARVLAHLSTGCDRCAREVRFWDRSLAAIRGHGAPQPPLAPPPGFLQRALDVFDRLAPPPVGPGIERDAMRDADRSTERERARAAEEERDGIFQLLFAGNPHPMWLCDRETLRVLEVNEVACARYGYSRPEFLALRLSDLTASDDSAEPGTLTLGTVRHHARGGQLLSVALSAHPCRFGGREVLLVTGEDVTERLYLEEQLRQAQKMEAVGRLAGGVAHDFNNMLAVINGYSDLLAMALPADARLREYAHQIRQAGERAAGLTRQLLVFSRKQVLRPRVLDLNVALTAMEKMLGRLIGEDIELGILSGADLGSVEIDPGQVDQLVMNLVVNARDAMPSGGRLTIETANVELDESYARQHLEVRPGPYVMLAVSDTGCGMDAATQAHIFEPFFTTKGEGHGTGLGLSTVFGIVKQSGGEIRVYSEPGHGTTFKIYLPRVDVAARSEAAAAETPGLPRGAETILVAEDDAHVRELVGKILAMLGYSVLAAEHGEEAVALAAGHAGRIDLLISDGVMPGMSGRQLAETLQPRHPGLKVLYMSGYTDGAAVRHGLLEPGTPYLQKPFTPAALARRVRDLLDHETGTHPR